MRAARHVLRWAVRAVASLVMASVLFGFAALIGAVIPVNGDFREPDDGIPIEIISNGIHTEVLVPIRSGAGDWRDALPMTDFLTADARSNYLAFGWGDRAIFIDTPTWGDLKVTNAAKALLGMNGTVMHVAPYFIDATLPPPADAVRIRLSVAQLRVLTRYLEAGFARDADGRIPKKLTAPGPWRSDAFYSATGRYSPLLTCNEWLRRGLAEAGIRMPLWSPLAQAILYQAGKGAGPISGIR